MGHKEAILETIKKNAQQGILGVQSIYVLNPELKPYIIRSCLQVLVKEGDLIRLERGVYKLPEDSKITLKM